MKKEIVSILVLVVVLILAGWGIGLFLNKDRSSEENTISEENIISEEGTSSEESVISEEGISSEESVIDKKEENTMKPKITSWDSAPKMQIDTEKSYKAIMKTTKGEMEIKLFAQDTPITVNNFVFLAKEKFYENTKFHRIIKGFMIQGGDPNGTGAGGPGYKFDDEPITRDYKRGILAMANAGPNTNGSQFFIMHQDYALPKNYVIFGKVISGLDTLDEIAETRTEDNGMGEISSPVEDILIKSIEIIES
jgi:peptidylprolyl isomerase